MHKARIKPDAENITQHIKHKHGSVRNFQPEVCQGAMPRRCIQPQAFYHACTED